MIGNSCAKTYIEKYNVLVRATDGLRAVVERAVTALDEWRDESQRADLVDIANALRAALGSAPPDGVR